MRKIFSALVFAAVLFSRELVRNGGFVDSLPTYGAMPVEWHVENAGDVQCGFVDEESQGR